MTKAIFEFDESHYISALWYAPLECKLTSGNIITVLYKCKEKDCQWVCKGRSKFDNDNIRSFEFYKELDDLKKEEDAIERVNKSIMKLIKEFSKSFTVGELQFILIRGDSDDLMRALLKLKDPDISIEYHNIHIH